MWLSDTGNSSLECNAGLWYDAAKLKRNSSADEQSVPGCNGELANGLQLLLIPEQTPIWITIRSVPH